MRENEEFRSVIIMKLMWHIYSLDDYAMKLYLPYSHKLIEFFT
jgi:hypothetical protein